MSLAMLVDACAEARSRLWTRATANDIMPFPRARCSLTTAYGADAKGGYVGALAYIVGAWLDHQAGLATVVASVSVRRSRSAGSGTRHEVAASIKQSFEQGFEQNVKCPGSGAH
jgi:hypothetical protein